MEPVSNADKLAHIRKKVYFAAEFEEKRINLSVNEVQLLLSELDDERTAHNEHAAELCQMESRLQSIQQERDIYKKERDYLMSPEYLAIQNKALDTADRRALQAEQERDKLIAGLQSYTDDHMFCPNCGKIHSDKGEYARNILRAIGVGEERT